MTQHEGDQAEEDLANVLSAVCFDGVRCAALHDRDNTPVTVTQLLEAGPDQDLIMVLQ